MNIKKREKKTFVTNQELLSNFRNRSMCLIDRNKSQEVKHNKNSNLGLLPEKKMHHPQQYSTNTSRIQTNRQQTMRKEKSSDRFLGIQMKNRVNSVASMKSLYEAKTPYNELQFHQQRVENDEHTYRRSQILKIAEQISQFFGNRSIKLIFQEKMTDLEVKKQKKREFKIAKRESTTKNTSNSNQIQLIKKIQQLYSEKTTLKKQKKILEKQLKEAEHKLQKQLNYTKSTLSTKLTENSSFEMNKPSQMASFDEKISEQKKLQSMLTKQSQIISMQNNEYFQMAENLRRMLYTQAKGLEKDYRKYF